MYVLHAGCLSRYSKECWFEMKIVRDENLFALNDIFKFRKDCMIQETSAELVEG